MSWKGPEDPSLVFSLQMGQSGPWRRQEQLSRAAADSAPGDEPEAQGTGTPSSPAAVGTTFPAATRLQPLLGQHWQSLPRATQACNDPAPLGYTSGKGQLRDTDCCPLWTSPSIGHFLLEGL